MNLKLSKPRTILVAYFSLVFLFAILPINNSHAKVNHIFILDIRLDYLIHAVQFIPYGFLVWYYHKFSSVKFSHLILFWILPGIFFATLSECIQYFTTWRTFNINDLLANFLGIIFGLAVFLFPVKSKSNPT